MTALNPNEKALSGAIAQYRFDSGLTLAELGEELGMAPATLSRFLGGEKVLSSENIALIRERFLAVQQGLQSLPFAQQLSQYMNRFSIDEDDMAAELGCSHETLAALLIDCRPTDEATWERLRERFRYLDAETYTAPAAPEEQPRPLTDAESELELFKKQVDLVERQAIALERLAALVDQHGTQHTSLLEQIRAGMLKGFGDLPLTEKSRERGV